MKNLGKIIPAASLLIALSAFSACEKKQEPPPPPVTTVAWTWASGSKTVNQAGAYGTKGVPSATNSDHHKFKSAGLHRRLYPRPGESQLESW